MIFFFQQMLWLIGNQNKTLLNKLLDKSKHRLHSIKFEDLCK